MFIITLSTWFFAKKRNSVCVGIFIPVLMLAYFKYTNFFAGSFAKLSGMEYTVLKIILPIGISFYTFSAIGYLVDVYRGKGEAKNFKDVALYLAYFPKITSGPIQKSDDFFRQIAVRRNIGWKTFSPGMQIFVFGLFKKIVFALLTLSIKPSTIFSICSSVICFAISSP